MNTEKWTVWGGDAEDLLSSLPQDIDLLVTDPPYGKEFLSNRTTLGESIEGDADQDKIDRILRGVWSKIRPHRHGYIFGPKREISGAYSELIWDKKYMSSGSLDSPWGNQHEIIGFYAHRYPSEPSAGKLSARLRSGSIVRVASPRGSARKGLHPNYKPVDLWRSLIESSSNPGDLVIDPFAGSFSSGVACLLTGRRYIGVELNPVWAEAGRKRMAEVEAVLKQV